MFSFFFFVSLYYLLFIQASPNRNDNYVSPCFLRSTVVFEDQTKADIRKETLLLNESTRFGGEGIRSITDGIMDSSRFIVSDVSFMDEEQQSEAGNKDEIVDW